jgi:hypothetical protein
MCLLQVLSFLSFFDHLHLLWVSIDFGGVMILFCALCIHIQKFFIMHKSWGASLVSLEYSFGHIIRSFDCLFQLVYFDLLHLLWVSIGFGGAMILFCACCMHIQKFYIVHKSWGASLVSLEHSFALIIISFSRVASRVTWLLASLGIFYSSSFNCLFQLVSFILIACFSSWYAFVSYYLFAIFGSSI